MDRLVLRSVTVLTDINVVPKEGGRVSLWNEINLNSLKTLFQNLFSLSVIFVFFNLYSED